MCHQDRKRRIMTCQKSIRKSIVLRLVMSIAVLVCLFITTRAQQQQSWSPVDNGRTAAFVLPSASGIDEINLYNGRVSLRVPIGTIGGRGKAIYQPTGSISRVVVLRRVNDWVQGSGEWFPPPLQL